MTSDAFTIGAREGMEKTASTMSWAARRALMSGVIGAGAGSLAAGEGRRGRGALYGAAGGVTGGMLGGPITSAVLGGLTGRSQHKMYDGFKSTLKVNPNSQELEKAFALYKKETGKDPGKMSYGEINKYVKKVRGR